MTENQYVHGYSPRESDRLLDQANTLTKLLHHDTIYPTQSNVLEAGCGVGAQTAILAENNPNANITSIDISDTSLAIAKETIEKLEFNNVQFQQADIFNLPRRGNVRIDATLGLVPDEDLPAAESRRSWGQVPFPQKVPVPKSPTSNSALP